MSTIRLSGLMSGLDTENIVQQLMKVQRLKTQRVEKNITKLEWTQDRWKSLNTKLYSFYTGPLSRMRMQGSFNAKSATSSNESVIEVTANSSAPEGNHRIQVISMASSQFVTGERLNQDVHGDNVTSSTKLVDLGFEQGTKIFVKSGENDAVELEVTAETTISNFITMARSAGLNANFDSAQQRIFLSSRESGVSNAFTITTSTDNENNENKDELSNLGLTRIFRTENGTIDTRANIPMVRAADAEVEYNGARLTSSTNTFSANGLTFNVRGIAPNEVINVSVSKNTQAAYNMIKDFVKSYNEILKEMSGAYHADMARGFEPLTDEEKEAMTDRQIEQWEERVKASLLRRDSTLNNIMNSMRNTMGRGVNLDGRNLALSSFGITTGNYLENGLLHIHGDVDGSMPERDNRLMQALAEDPESVMRVMNELASELYSSMSNQMRSTSLSSALTFYNDKAINNQITRHRDDLQRLEKRLMDMEDRYYRQFTAMEKALANMNSQSASLMSMFGFNSQ